MRNLGKYIFWLLVAGYCYAITMNTARNGPDFSVYWRTAHFFLEGDPVYSATRDGIMTFKYPPWIFPLFLPFGLLSLTVAKLIWGEIEALALLYIIFWLQKRAKLSVIAVCLLCFSGIWTVHAFDGQVSLPLTACALALFSVFRDNTRNSKSFLLAYLLSTKIFTMFPFLGFKWRNSDFFRIGALVALLAICSLPVIIAHNWNLSDLVTQYKIATGPGVDASGNPQITVKGDQAQGFVSMIFRVANLDYRNQTLIFFYCGLLSLFFWDFLAYQGVEIAGRCSMGRLAGVDSDSATASWISHVCFSVSRCGAIP